MDIFEMIKQRCPDGVEYKNLEDCCNILDKNRKPICKSNREQGNYPYYGANGIQDYVSDYIFDGTYVLVGEDGSVITEDEKPVVNWAEGKIWVNNHAHVISEIDTVNLRYLFYCLQTINVKPFVRGSIPKLTGGDFRLLRIPIPPLDVQQELVSILDKFDVYCNDMTAGLAGELAMRKKQFEYYRDKLIDEYTSFNSVLGDYFTQVSIKAGPDFPRENLRVVSNTMGLVSKDEYAKVQEVSSDLSNYKVVFPGQFAYNPRRFDVGSVAYNKENFPVAVSPAYQVFSVENIDPDYLMHLFRHKFFDCQRVHYTEKGAGSKFTFDKFKYVVIPVPDILSQRKVAEYLNQFQELEKELELRKKQYEYYRDKLLDFPEKAV